MTTVRTDSMQATIWRIQDARFASPHAGVNGLRVDPMRSKIYVSVTTDMLGGSYIDTLWCCGAVVLWPDGTELRVDPFLCTSMRRQRSRAASALPVHA